MENEELHKQLLELRNKIAKEKKIPPYVIFQNATLIDMAEKKPQTKEELLAMKQVSISKVTKYGTSFIDLIRKF